MLVPKLVKNGFYSSFAYLRLIWTWLIVGLGCVETDSARRSKTDVRLKTASKSPKKNKYHF